jgi:UDP-3-O-[3-hydroxymyristoyl] glucosamine N-acyltransferase
MALKLKELAERLECEVIGDGDVLIERVAPIEDAGSGSITFIVNPKYLSFAETTKAEAIIVGPQMTDVAKNLLVAKNPYLASARAVGILMDTPRVRRPGIHATAVVDESVQLGEGSEIGPLVVVEAGSVIGSNVTIMPGSYVGPNVTIGDDTFIHPNVSIYHGVRIGQRCAIHSSTVIGGDGFGWAPDGPRYERIPQVGTTILGDDVSVGSSVAINRGALGDTVIGSGTKIDSLVTLAHNVEIGENCIIVSQVGISGSVKVGEHCTFGGQVGVAGHLKIGDNVTIAAQGGVSHDLAPNRVYIGAPARPLNQGRKALAAFQKLPELRKDIKHVQKRMEELSAMLDKNTEDIPDPGE